MRKVWSVFSLLIVACLVWQWASPAFAKDAVDIGGAHIVEYGIFDAYFDEENNIASDIKLLKKTYKIPLEPGIFFGIRYVILGTPERAKVSVNISLTHPPVTDTETGRKTTSYTVEQNVEIGTARFQGQRIQASTFVPGKYLYAVYVGDKLLVQREFELVAPAKSVESKTTQTPEKPEKESQ